MIIIVSLTIQALYHYHSTMVNRKTNKKKQKIAAQGRITIVTGMIVIFWTKKENN